MMKKIIVAGSLFLTAVLAAAQKKQAKIEYVFPDAMAAPIRAEYLKLSEKGRALYELSCAQCHNTMIKGKQVIPDFTEEQLGAYSIRVANPKHEEQVSEMNVSAEELTLISTFLTYKKKNEPLLLINNGLAHQ